MPLTTLELFNESLKFSAGHFTIFSATQRENLHGHNYSVQLSITHHLRTEGLNYDYRHYRDKVQQLCNQLDITFLLPEHSPHLRFEPADPYLNVYFDNEKIPLLKRDVTLLPLANITLEELARWFIQQLTTDSDALAQHQIHSLTIKVANGPGQQAIATWCIG